MATIRQRENKWQVQVRRAGSRAVSRSFLLRKDACAWARQMEVQADKAGLPADPKRLKTVTLGELIKRYQAEITVGKRGARVEQAGRQPFVQRTVALPLARHPVRPAIIWTILARTLDVRVVESPHRWRPIKLSGDLGTEAKTV